MTDETIIIELRAKPLERGFSIEALAGDRVLEEVRRPWGPLNKNAVRDALDQLGAATSREIVRRLTARDDA